MGSYVLMLQADPDDKLITESVLSEREDWPPVLFLPGVSGLARLLEDSGEPAVILLNDSGASHRESQVLKQVKSLEGFAHVPVIVLGELASPEYIRSCYKAGASTYIVKPSSLQATRKKIESFFTYWFEVAEIDALHP